MAMRVTGEPFSGPDVIDRIDALIAADPTAIRLRFARASALHDLSRNVEAERAYLDVLARDPNHFGALTNLGTLLHVAGKRDVARALYTKAAIEHPNEPIACVNLGNALAEAGEIDAAIATYERAFTIVPGYANAHFALSLLYRGLGQSDEALRHHQLAFAKTKVSVAPALASDRPMDVLMLTAANGGNVVTAPLIDRSAVRLYTLVVEGYRPEMEIPPHHAVFNAVGDADRASVALAAAAAIVERSGAPVINRPARVATTSRAEVTERLGALPGVIAPKTQLIARESVTPAGLAAAGFAFPVLLRSPGYHTGQHFVSVADADELAAQRDALPGKELLAIAFLDGRGPDGNFRKYRVLFIDGRLYPLHLAISRAWKVHYFSADMGDRADHRAEEARFLADMRGVLGPATMNALERIERELGLDYGGIDFGLDAAGNVLVYEANATMAVFPAPPDERFAYRRPAVDRVLAAAHELVRARARAGGFVEP
jgi:Tfp pilus assembly protein PilF/glutathione synthase/RimK-type ligase-like ATP-grasp enzyme